jgi:hypothetical protein
VDSLKAYDVAANLMIQQHCQIERATILPSTSAKTKSPSSNLFSLLYPQTQKNEIEVSLKYGIALLFQSVL